MREKWRNLKRKKVRRMEGRVERRVRKRNSVTGYAMRVNQRESEKWAEEKRWEDVHWDERRWHDMRGWERNMEGMIWDVMTRWDRTDDVRWEEEEEEEKTHHDSWHFIASHLFFCHFLSLLSSALLSSAFFTFLSLPVWFSVSQYFWDLHSSNLLFSSFITSCHFISHHMSSYHALYVCLSLPLLSCCVHLVMICEKRREKQCKMARNEREMSRYESICDDLGKWMRTQEDGSIEHRRWNQRRWGVWWDMRRYRRRWVGTQRRANQSGRRDRA